MVANLVTRKTSIFTFKGVKMKVIVDTETTNLLEAMGNQLEFQPHMIEIFALKIDDNLKPVEEFYSLIKPPVPIPQFITRITGISDIDVVKSPPFKKIAKKLQKFLKGTDLFIAHNATFDYDIIENEFKRIGMKSNLPKKLYCTVEQSMFYKGYRLKNLELYKILTGKTEIKNQHRAKADVFATLENYKKLIKVKVKCS